MQIIHKANRKQNRIKGEKIENNYEIRFMVLWHNKKMLEMMKWKFFLGRNQKLNMQQHRFLFIIFKVAWCEQMYVRMFG